MGHLKIIPLFFALVLLSSVALADYIDAGADSIVKTNSIVFVKGYVRLDNSSGIQNVNVSVNLSGSANSTLTSSTGYFNLNVTSPASAGDYNVSITTNISVSKQIEISVRNVSTATFIFADKKPPFVNGTTFLLNVTFDGTPTTAPVLKIFNPNGNETSGWTVTNTTPASTSTIQYSVTVPGSAAGTYIAVVENGAGFITFLVKPNTVMSVSILLEDSLEFVFVPGETATISAKIRDDSSAITDASIIAFITLPDNTVENVTLAHSSTTNGTYAANYSGTDDIGSYVVKVVATVDGQTFTGFSLFEVKQLDAKLDIVKDFFFEFGASSSFGAGGQVAFNLLVFNESDDSVLLGNLSGPPVNCTSINPVSLKNLSGASFPFSVTKSVGNFFGQDVCKINFTAPSADGVYSAVVNVTVNGANVSATGFFSVQSYILKASPISSLGSGHDFLSFLTPGDNATFEVGARNLTKNGTEVNNSLITGIAVARITPLEIGFGGTQADITGVNFTVTPGSGSTKAKVTVLLPENKTGPFNIEFSANVGGSQVKGTAFYFAKYIDGFAFPDGMFNFGPSGGGTPFRCGGTQTFTAKTFDLSTRQGAKNVVFNSIQEVREENTGRSVSSFVNLSSSATTDSNGETNLSIIFSPSTSFSGFYFMLFNVTTSAGKTDIIPGGFECKVLNFFPQVESESTGDFQISPTAGVNITITGIKKITGSPTPVDTGSASIIRLENFDPAKGPTFMQTNIGPYPLIGGNVTFTVTPSDFSLPGNKWPSGFVDLRVQVCDNSTVPQVCDTSFGGFKVVSFDAFSPDIFSIGQVSPNENVTITVMTRTNVTRDSGNYSGPGSNTTTTGFTVSVGNPWEGASVDLTTTGVLSSDNWNNSAHQGFESWNVTFTIPSSGRKGDNFLSVKVKNYLGDSSTLESFITIVKYTVFVPDTEGVFLSTYFIDANASIGSNITSVNNTYGININLTNAQFNVFSKSGRACASMGLNATRFGPSQATVPYGPAISVLVIDNATPFVYDTVIVRNNATGQTAVVHSGNRSLSYAGTNLSTVYLRAVQDCGFFELINSSVAPTGFGSGFGGQQQKGTIFAIPIIVKQGSTPIAGATVDVAQIVKQEDFGGGRGGFGFTGFLSTGFTKTVGVTNADGVAFITLNITTGGSYGLLWNISVGSDTDTAGFSQVIPIEIKSMDTYGNVAGDSQRIKVVTFTKNSTETRNATLPGSDSPIFVTTWNESVQGTLFNELLPTDIPFYYLALRNYTQQNMYNSPLSAIPGGAFTELIIDNEGNLNTTQLDTQGEPGGNNFGPLFGNMTDRFEGNQPIQRQLVGDSFAIDGNKTVNENVTQLLFVPTEVNGFSKSVSGSGSRIDVNVTVRVCANTFDRPRAPVEGAAIILQTQVFANGPPQTFNLTMYDPYTNLPVSTIFTGPSGCAMFNVSRIDPDTSRGWTAGQPNDIKGTVTKGADTDNVFVGNVFVSCPSYPC